MLCRNCANRKIGFLIVLFSLFSLAGNAITYVWTGFTENWSDPNNWTPTGIPQKFDDVVISGGFILLDVANAEVQSLFISDGILDGSENLIVNGNFNWTGGTIGGAGILRVLGTLEISGTSNKTLSGKSLQAEGTGSWSGGNLSISNGVTFLITSGATFFIDHTSTQTLGSGASGVVEIQGSLTKTENSITRFSGTLKLTGGSLNINAGSFETYLSASGTHTGSITLASGTSFKLSSGTHEFNSGFIMQGQGTFLADGATVNFNTGSSLSCPVTLSSGGFNDNSGLSISSLIQTNGTLGGSDTTVVTGIFNWSRGTISTSGKIKVTGNLDINGSNSKTLSTGTLESTHAGTWSDGNINIGTTAIFRIKAGATFTIDHTVTRTLGSSSGGLVAVLGTLTKTKSSTTNINCTFSTVGNGIFNINAGTVVTGASSSGNHTGAIVIANSALLNFANGTHHFNNLSTVSGDGISRVSGALVYFNSGSSLTCNLEVTGGTLTDNQSIQPSSYFQSAGTFTGDGDPTCTGNLTWSGGTISGLGQFSVEGTSSFIAGGSRMLDTKIIALEGNGAWTGGSFTFVNSAVMIVQSNSTLSLDHISDESMSGDGSLSINGIMSKNHETAITSFSGVEVLNNGSIIGTGHLSYSREKNEGIYAPGFSPGTLHLNSFDNTDGTYIVEIQSTNGEGSGHDHMAVAGTATLGGTLTVTLLDGFVPVVGNSFTIIRAALVNGTFDTQNLPALPPDRKWATIYGPTETMLIVEAALPVELVNFEVRATDEKVEMIWQTASEQNNLGFEILRSANANQWQNIGFTPGQGTTTLAQHYYFEDVPPADGTWYYRLRQVDFDGNAKWSPIKSVAVNNMLKNELASLYPNPYSGGDLIIRLNEKLITDIPYQVFDMQGGLLQLGILKAATEGNSQPFEFEPISSGVYFLMLDTLNGPQIIRLIVVPVR